MNEEFEIALNRAIEAWLKSRRNDPWRYGSPKDPDKMIPLLILQKLTEIGNDIAAIREALALREAEGWTRDLP